MSTHLRELSLPEELDQVFTDSTQRLQLVFKHSTTCPISGRGFQGLQQHLETPSTDVDYSLIVVQRARPLSTSVAERTSVRHESPQALLVKDGKAVWNASHYDITADSLQQAIKTQLSGETQHNG